MATATKKKPVKKATKKTPVKSLKDVVKVNKSSKKS